MDKGKLKRSGQILAPSIFTVGNMVCGFYALLAAHMGEYTSGGVAILAGIVFDMLDGRVARMVHGESTFGVEFDSLADFLTFCVSPAYLVYALLLKDYGIGGFAVAFIFALCGGLRLARFNAVVHAGEGSKTQFQGLPTPAAAGFLASFILLYEIVELDQPARTLSFIMDQIPWVAAAAPFVVLVLSFLMVSNVPYAAGKKPDLLHPRNVKLMVGVGLFLVFLYFYPQNALFLLFLFYVLSGFTNLLMPGRPSAPVKDGAGSTPA